MKPNKLTAETIFLNECNHDQIRTSNDLQMQKNRTFF